MNPALKDLTAGEPNWVFPGPHDETSGGEEAARFLSALEREDLDLMVLSYGLGQRVGPVSQALGIDPALVVWRLHRAFSRWRRQVGGKRDPARLERGLTDLLRGREQISLPPPDGRRDWTVDGMLQGPHASVRRRLAEGLTASARQAPAAAGVGIGLAVVVLAVAVGFLAFGVVRDVDPMRRGNALMQQYEYSQARDAFLQLGTVEARVRVVLCLLAEGNFDQALAEFENPDVRSWYRQFAPTEPEPVAESLPAASRALLPRGLVSLARPPFVIRAGPPGELVVWNRDQERRLPLPDTRGGADSFVVPYPEGWSALAAGRVLWRVEDGDDNPGLFDLGDRELSLRIRERNWRVLTRDVPQKAQWFLRGHHFLSEGLLMQAGWQFARLAEAFPAEPYPRQMIWDVAAALGVDPTALLR